MSKQHFPLAGISIAIGFVALVIVLIAIAVGIDVAIVYYAWNLAISPIFHIGQLSVLQAALVGLAVLLVGGAFRTSTSVKTE